MFQDFFRPTPIKLRPHLFYSIFLDLNRFSRPQLGLNLDFQVGGLLDLSIIFNPIAIELISHT